MQGFGIEKSQWVFFEAGIELPLTSTVGELVSRRETNKEKGCVKIQMIAKSLYDEVPLSKLDSILPTFSSTLLSGTLLEGVVIPGIGKFILLPSIFKNNK